MPATALRTTACFIAGWASLLLGAGCATSPIPAGGDGPVFHAVMRPVQGGPTLGVLHFASQDAHLEVSGRLVMSSESDPMALVVLHAPDCPTGEQPGVAARVFEPAGRTLKPDRRQDGPAALLGWLTPDGGSMDAGHIRSRRLELAGGSMFDIRGRPVALFRQQQLGASTHRRALPLPVACGVVTAAG